MGNNRTKLKRLSTVEKKKVVEEKIRMVTQTNVEAVVIQDRRMVFFTINFYFISIF